MKTLNILCIVLWAFVSGLYLGKIEGIKQSDFNRSLADTKLQQCQDIIKNGKI